MESLRVNFFGNLINIFCQNQSEHQNELEIFRYLSSLESSPHYHDLKSHSRKLNQLKDLEWLNCSKHLDISNDLKGKIILIDFWTYCCINCIHLIPLLNQLEHEFKELAVLGVHSSKFSNEKSLSNVLNATKRHLIKHPVVCDFDMKIWNDLGILCWPTVLVLNPDGVIIAEFQGELQANFIRQFLKICFKFYETKLNNLLEIDILRNFNNLKLENSNNLNSLCFPTKLFFDSSENLLFISDSGNNRVLVVNTKTNEIIKQIGNGRQGFLNGEFLSSKFDWPQGLAYDSETKILYIADTYNDLIRIADFKTYQIKTVCGIERKNSKSIGEYDYKGGKKGLEQSISSPWDICLFNKEKSKVLLIACAGTHQIWLYSFENQSFLQKIEANQLNWWKNVKIEWQVLVCIAGNGKEKNKNNSYPMQASFAQPSGLCLDKDEQNVYIADAESSTIRSLNLKDGSVRGLVGGDNLQPDNLFAYGDLDGKGNEAKLQHPLDVKYFKQNLLVCDTYNNCIKRIDLKSKMCQKLFVKNEVNLNEPNSLCIDKENRFVWIADSNNHEIKLIKNFDTSSNQIELEEYKINFKDKIELNNKEENSFLKLKFNFKLNSKAENSWNLRVVNQNGSVSTYLGLFDKFSLISEKDQIYKLNLKENIEEINLLELDISLFYCENDGLVCKLFKKKVLLNQKDLIKIGIQSDDANLLICLD